MHQKRFFILLLALNLMIGACSHSSQTVPAQVSIVKIRNGQQMIGVSKTLGCMWITNEDQLFGLMDRIDKGTKIPAGPIAPLEIDFAEYGVLVVWMGQMPTGGYALDLMAETAEIKNQTALVPVRWIEPKKESLTIQIITNPYLMIRMAKGNYDTIAVIDQNGLVKIQIRDVVF